MRLWDLPGARRFVDSTCDLLRSGSSVVVRFPGAIPDGFEDAVGATLGNALQIGRLAVTSRPLDDLARQYSGHPDHIRRLPDLCEEAGFRGRLVIPYGFDGINWPIWRDFLGTYAQASRSRSLLGRSLFLVMLDGVPPPDPPLADVGLAVSDWDGVLDDVDLLLFASEHMRDRGLHPLQRSLFATTVARVAAWDFETAAALAGEDDRTIMNPVELLRAVAHDRCWTTDTPLDWQLGTASRAGLAHPARAALDNPSSDLCRRLWSAQLAVLLPWIEERRHEIVSSNLFEVKRQMRAAGDGQGDPFALELGELFTLFLRRGADRRVRKTVGRLRDVRNELAHRRHLPFQKVESLIEKVLL